MQLYSPEIDDSVAIEEESDRNSAEGPKIASRPFTLAKPLEGWMMDHVLLPGANNRAASPSRFAALHMSLILGRHSRLMAVETESTTFIDTMPHPGHA